MGRKTGSTDIGAYERRCVLSFLATRRKPCGKLMKGAIKAAVQKYGRHANTIRNLWEGREREDLPTKRENCGSERVHDPDELMELVAAVLVHRRTSVRATASAVNVPHASLQRHIGKGKAQRAVTVHVKPTMTDDQLQERLRFVLSFVDRPIGLRTKYFDPMYDTVHVDEKWFYVQKVASRLVLTRDEPEPHLTCPSKRFITKVMFLAAVARPRYNYDRDTGFDGKLGIFPIIQEKIAQRTTKNQTRGETVPQPLSVDRHVYYDLLVSKVLPAIKTKMPGRRGQTIWIQQDNASPHVSAEKAVKDAGLDAYAWDVQIRRQPPKSPDLNILDLGFFHGIQSLQHQEQVFSVPDLVAAVCRAYANMPTRTLEKCFLTLQAVMEEILLVGGGNNYDLPRVKSVHFPDGIFPTALKCTDRAYKAGVDALKPTPKKINPPFHVTNSDLHSVSVI